MIEAREPFAPNGPFQVRAYWSWALVVALLGRIGSSKSRTLLEAADYDCRTWPRNRVAVCRKLAVDLFGSVKDIFDTYVLHEGELRWWREHKLGGSMVLYPNGSQMRWFGLDNPGKALSAEYGAAYVDQAEELEPEEMRTLEGRIRLRRPPAMARLPDGSVRLIPLRRRTVYAFNAMPETHWANTRFGFQAMQSPGGVQSRDPETWQTRKLIRTEQPTTLLSGETVPAGELLAEVLIAEPSANLENLGRDYQIRIAEQRGPWYDRYVLALVGSFEGKVFPSFSSAPPPAGHVLDEPPLEWGWQDWGGYPPPPSFGWKRYRAVDFGYENPFVMSWITRVPADNPVYPGAWVHYQEIYMTHRIVAQHARVAKGYDAEELAALNRGLERWNAQHPGERKEPLTRLRFSQQVCDHDAEDRATLESEGIVMDPAVKDRSSGIQEVHRHIEPPIERPSGWFPTLLFMRRARRELDPELDPRRRQDEAPVPTCTWEEMGGLRWPKPPTSTEKAPKEDVVKVNDHGFDGILYHLRSFKDRGEMRVHRLYDDGPRDDD